MLLVDLEQFDQFILSLCGTHEIEHQKPRRILGVNGRTANYLVSLKIFEYCGSGDYKLTPLGWELYYQGELKFINGVRKPNEETSINELQISNT